VSPAMNPALAPAAAGGHDRRRMRVAPRTLRGRAVIGGTVVLLVLAAGCQRERSEREPTPLDLATVGTIAGEVRFEGAVPAQTVLQVGSFAECAAQHSGPVLAGDVLVHDGRVENAIVYVSEGLGDRVFAVPDAAVVIDQQGCLFVPRVAAAQVGQEVRFLNSDPLPHNVHGTPQRSRGWNFMLGVKGASRATTVGAPEPVIEIKCDVHPWMKAYLGAFDHPYFAVTGRDGRFTLENVPPGTYVVTVWHERFGTRSTSVELPPTETRSIVVTFAAE
jgi:plastocyanin